MSKDYYKILGVDKSASSEEIKKAYYKLAHQHHPHKGGDEAKMKEINEAYGVLGSPEKKQQYDTYGSAFNQSGGGFSGFDDFAKNYSRGQQAGGFSFDFGDLGDVFGDLFGQSNRNRGSSVRSGSDIKAELNLNFNEAVFGVEKIIQLQKDGACSSCGGSGAEVNSKIITCATCKGQGQVVKNIGFGFGFPSVCPDCQGRGKKAEKKCGQCKGLGIKKEHSEIKVKIPAGIDNGQTIRLTGRGNVGSHGGETGDLYLKIRINPDTRFKREGFDIRSQAEISFSQAALGAKIKVATVSGEENLVIPEATQSGKVLTIKNAGVPFLNDKGRGNHLVEIIVKTPGKLNRRQRELFEELSASE